MWVVVSVHLPNSIEDNHPLQIFLLILVKAQANYSFYDITLKISCTATKKPVRDTSKN